MVSDRHPDLNDLRTFMAVAGAGGFTAAAEQLGVAKARVSLQIKRLEQVLGIALFHRTTRQVTLTGAGDQLLADCQPLLQDIDQALMRASNLDRELHGTLRISAPVDFAILSLAPVIQRFAEQHPAVTLELRSSDRIIDAVKEGIDIAFRVGWLRDSSQRALKLGEFEQYLLAAPQYLALAGTPSDPEQLPGHRWIALTLLSAPQTWTFQRGSQASQRVQLQPALKVDSATLLRTLLLQGMGISVMDQPSAAADLASGRLVRLLADWSLPRGGIYAVFPPGRYLSPQARAFVRCCQQALASGAPPTR